MATSKVFGELLREGLRSAAHKQHRNMQAIQKEIADALEVKPAVVADWCRWRIPKQRERVKFLTEYCVKYGEMTRKWAGEFLCAAHYWKPEPLLLALFPDSETFKSSGGNEESISRSGLPPRPHYLIGRVDALDRLWEGLLMSRWPIISIEGIPGIGKTLLATEAGYRCLPGRHASANHFYEFVVWISARNRLEQEDWLSEVLDRIAQALNYRHIADLPLEEKHMEVSTLLRKYRVLIILDNFETMRGDKNLIEWLESIPGQSKVLLTSRTIDIRGAWVITIKGLSDQDAIQHIRNYATGKNLLAIANAQQDILMPLVEVTGAHPLAIGMALDHIARDGMTLDEVVEHLYQGNKSVADILDYVVSWAWETLSADARHLLMVLPLFAKAIDNALLSVTGWPEHRLERAKRELTEMSLLEVEGTIAAAQRRYSMHPIVRTFAKVRLTEYPAWDAEIRQRWVTYYLDFLEKKVCREGIEEPYWCYLGGGRIQTMGQDWPTLLNLLEWVDQNQRHQDLLELMMRLIHYMDRRAYDDIRIEYGSKAAAVAHTLGRPEVEALFRIDALGLTLRKIGRYEEALHEIAQGLACVDKLDPKDPLGDNLRALGYAFQAKVYIERGDPEKEDLAEAAALLAKASELEPKCTPVICHRVLVLKGDLAYKKGQYPAAIELYQTAENVWRPYMVDGDTDMAGVYRKLGFSYLAYGDLNQAEAKFSEVIAYKGQGGVLNDCQAKFGLAQVLKAYGGQDESAYRWARDAREGLSFQHPLRKKIDEFIDGDE